MTTGCDECREVVDASNSIHVLRECAGCGRELRVRSPGAHGIGVKVEKGDSLVLPPGFLSISLDPTKTSMRFSGDGIAWAAEMFVVEDLFQKRDQYIEEINRYSSYCEKIVRSSPLLSEVDLEQEDAYEILKDNRQDVAFWAYFTVLFFQLAKEAVEAGDAALASWRVACAERCRTMVVFKESLETPVAMAHAARPILDAMSLWTSSRDNSDEEFWQIKLREHSFLLSQIFSIPVMIIQNKAYLGGIDITGNGARIADFALASLSSSEVLIVEIKVPTARLLGRKYRGVFAPSPELTGSIVQALDYRNTLQREGIRLRDDSDQRWTTNNPKTVLIIGDGERELLDPKRRRAFELFRSTLKDVEVVTYDELFKKADVLIGLFGLARKPTA